MGKNSNNDLAYLKGTNFRALLVEIGRVKLDSIPKDPQLAFIERVNKFAEQLQESAREMDSDERERNPRGLRTAGLIRDLVRNHGTQWKHSIPRVLRGVVKSEEDSLLQQAERECNVT